MLAGMRMASSTDFLQSVLCHMGIDLRRHEILMSEQFLYGSEIRSVVEKMRRKGMSQHMRMHTARQTGCLSCFFRDSLDRTGSNRLASPVDKQIAMFILSAMKTGTASVR